MKDTTTDKDIMAAFDTTKVELEILAIKKKYELEINPNNKEERTFQHFFPCVRVKLTFVAMPQLAYQQEGFQRGAIHLGKTKIVIEGFVATQEEIDAYKKSIDEEDMKLLEAVNESIKALKDDLYYYLEKAGDIKEEKKEEKKSEGILSPFGHLLDGFKEIFGLPVEIRKSEGKGKIPKGEKEAAESIVKIDSYITYKIFKKQNQMFTE